MTDEQLLIEFLATKNGTILASLYDRMRPRLYALAFDIVKSQDEAEDIVADVFCKLYDLGPEPIQSAESLLFKITQNLAFTSQKAKRRGIRANMVSLDSLKRKRGVWDTENAHKRPTDSDLIDEPIDKNLEAARQQNENQEVVQRLWDKVQPAIGSLSDKQREAIELHYARGLSIAEIAECLHIKEETAATRVRRGLATLRRKLLLKGEIGRRRRSCPIEAKAADTGAVVREFPCVKAAATAGFAVASIHRALREGKVYRGLKWIYCNAV